MSHSKVTVRISGMRCASCVANVEKAIKKVNGVFDVGINLSTGKAVVYYDERYFKMNDMKNELLKAGYEIREYTEVIEENDVGKKDVLKIVLGLSVGGVLMLSMYLPITHIYFRYILPIISFPVFIYVSHEIYIDAFRSLKNKSLSMEVMYSMGMSTAFISSIMATFNILEKEFLLYDTSIMLASFLTLGRYLEDRAKGKTSEAIKKLMMLKPTTARVMKGGKEIEIPIENVLVGDIIIVKPGERIPVDGIVIDGRSHVDESMLTGEYMPVLKKRGMEAIGGTMNKDGIIKIKAVRVGREMFISQIMDIVDKAQSQKIRHQKIADKVISYFIPFIIISAVLSFIIWFFVVGEGMSFSVKIFISILVVACPCALGLATPTAVTVGMGKGAELGILIKDSRVFEIADKISVVIFDKTGTLTKGKPEVTDIVAHNVTERYVLSIAASVEKNSNHPIAEGIVNKCKESKIETDKCNNFENIEGMGVIGVVKNMNVAVGNKMLMEKLNIPIPRVMLEKANTFENDGKTVVYVSVNNNLIGVIAVSDALKSDGKDVILNLHKMGIASMILTGDNEETARSIARKIGIDDVHANVLPWGKSEVVKKMQNEGHTVAFVGDGINDAPALAQADFGIALGSGTDVAVESGEIVLIKDKLTDVLNAILLGRKVMNRIKWNLFWAFAYNIILIPIAAGVIYPITGWFFRPELAALAMAMSSLTVTLLSLSLKKFSGIS